MSKITADDVRKVAHLARLDLPEEKITTYTGQLERILDYVDQLQGVNTCLLYTSPSPRDPM